MKFDLVKTKNGYQPAADSDIEASKSIEYGEIVRCKSVDQRNYLFHKKYFALIRFTFHHLPERFDGQFMDEEDLREELLKAIGWKRTYIDFNGKEQTRAKSISYESVGQKRFEKIYQRTLDVVCRMLDTNEETIMGELLHFM